MAQEITIKQLFEDHLSLAWEQIAAYEYPYEVLADIGNIIKKITTDWEMEVLYGDGESIVETRKDPVNTENGSWFVDNFYFYDKAQIITDQDEWTCIEQKAIEDLQQ